METKAQLVIPQTKRVEKISKRRKFPEPREVSARPIKKFELLHRPFDLKFRGRLNKWLESYAGDSIKTALSRKENLLVKNYFFPSKNKWLTQKQVDQKLKLDKKGRLRGLLIESLLNVWNSTK